MYYAHFILSKKGPLAKIWLAAHWDKKLTKAQIYETNIESTIETILEPKMKLALRTSGHLLLGVCRIYSRKVKYLLADCNEAFVKIKMAFRPGLIDLPREKQQASADAITLQEKFPDFDINFVDINMEDIDLSKNIMTQQARIEDITLKEDYGNALLTTQDDDFGDMGFGMNTLLMNDDFLNMNDREERFRNNLDRDFNDDFNHESSNNVFNDKNMTSLRDMDQMETDATLEKNNDLELGDDNTFARPPELNGDSEQPGIVPNLFDDQPTVLTAINQNNDEPVTKLARLGDDDEEGINKENQLQPAKRATTRRKKKLIIDELKEIDSVTMKAQLNDTAAIMATLELAPPTRKLMLLKESGSIDKLLMNTSRPLTCAVLQKLYTNNMITKKNVGVSGKDDNKENRLANNIIDDNTSILSMQEKQRDNQNTTTDKLPLMDSIVDNDVTKHSNLMQLGGGDLTLDNNNFDNENAANLSGNNTLVKDPFNPNDLEMTQAQLEMTPPHQRQKSGNTSHRKSGVTNVTAVNNELLIDDDVENGESQKILNKRAKTMISILNKSLTKHANIGFFELTKRNGRKQVAQKFYSLLILKKYDAIDVTQVDSFGDIIITKSGKFENFVTC